MLLAVALKSPGQLNPNVRLLSLLVNIDDQTVVRDDEDARPDSNMVSILARNSLGFRPALVFALRVKFLRKSAVLLVLASVDHDEELMVLAASNIDDAEDALDCVSGASAPCT